MSVSVLNAALKCGNAGFLRAQSKPGSPLAQWHLLLALAPGKLRWQGGLCLPDESLHSVEQLPGEVRNVLSSRGAAGGYSGGGEGHLWVGEDGMGADQVREGRDQQNRPPPYPSPRLGCASLTLG